VWTRGRFPTSLVEAVKPLVALMKRQVTASVGRNMSLESGVWSLESEDHESGVWGLESGVGACVVAADGFTLLTFYLQNVLTFQHVNL
jgi:hypothetical protein